MKRASTSQTSARHLADITSKVFHLALLFHKTCFKSSLTQHSKASMALLVSLMTHLYMDHLKLGMTETWIDATRNQTWRQESIGNPRHETAWGYPEPTEVPWLRELSDEIFQRPIYLVSTTEGPDQERNSILLGTWAQPSLHQGQEKSLITRCT